MFFGLTVRVGLGVVLASVSRPALAGEVPHDARWGADLSSDLRIGGSDGREAVPTDLGAADAAAALERATELASPDRPLFQMGHTLFVNTAGSPNVTAALSSPPAIPPSKENSRMDTTTVDGCGGPFPADPSTDAQKAALLEALKKDFAPFNLRVTDTRPPADQNYTMVLVGPRSGCCPPMGGIAGLYCAGVAPNSTAFACFASNAIPVSAGAAIVAQEAAHTWGLLHVNSTNDIMRPAQDSTDPSFVDQCFTANPAQYCPNQRLAVCPGGEQNSFKELMNLFGPSPGSDPTPPTVQITYPPNGARIRTGSSFNIQAQASDNLSVSQVSVSINAENLPADGTPPYEWPAKQIPDNTYTVIATAQDASGNKTMSAPVTFTVAPDGVDPAMTTTATTTVATNPTSTSTTTAPTSTQSPTATSLPVMPPTDGCECQAGWASGTGANPTGLAFLGFALAPFVRRRRPAPSRA